MNVRLYNISIKCMLAILLAGLFASCKDEMDEADEKEYRPSRIESLGIAFRTSDDGFEKPKTRGVLETFNIDDKVSVLAMKENNGTWVRVFDNNILDITNIGEVKWYYENKKKWEKGYRYKFRGFYPQTFNNVAGETDACDAGFSFEIAGNNKDKNKGQPLGTDLTLTNYTSANNPRNNTDILISETVNRDCSTSIDASIVPLKMKHLLACVDFRIRTKKDKKLHINSFTVNGYAPSGNCSVKETPIWTPKWNENKTIVSGGTYNIEFTYKTNDKSLTENTNDFIFKDKLSNLEISPADLYNKGTEINDSYLYNYGSKHGAFYVILKSEYNTSTASLGSADTDGSKEETEYYEKDNYKGLLFVPQTLSREGSAIKIRPKVTIQTEGTDWRGRPTVNTRVDDNVKDQNVELKHSTFAKIEFYFDDKSSEVMTAYVDLTANNKVKSWDAGIRYVYTITMNEYQATANITIEDWHTHSYEEDLR